MHPEQWSDEDFVELSFEARLLAIAIRNFADDKGVFEWKPRTIKMRVFPADNVDCEDLLAQLIAQDQVVRFVCDDKEFGAIRNFRKFQRPKKPNDIYPINQEIREYVGIADGEIEADEGCAMGDELPTGSENTDQMEDVGCKKKESCAISQFEDFWDSFPHRGGIKRNRKTAFERYKRAVKSGATEAELVAGAKVYGPQCKKIDKLPRDPTTWLNQEGWKDEVAVPAQISEIDVARRNAEAIKSGKEWQIKHVSASSARDCISRGLITEDECRKAGVL